MSKLEKFPERPKRLITSAIEGLEEQISQDTPASLEALFYKEIIDIAIHYYEDKDLCKKMGEFSPYPNG